MHVVEGGELCRYLFGQARGKRVGDLLHNVGKRTDACER